MLLLPSKEVFRYTGCCMDDRAGRKPFKSANDNRDLDILPFIPNCWKLNFSSLLGFVKTTESTSNSVFGICSERLPNEIFSFDCFNLKDSPFTVVPEASSLKANRLIMRSRPWSLSVGTKACILMSFRCRWFSEKVCAVFGISHRS